jgi:hypothetical protein
MNMLEEMKRQRPRPVEQQQVAFLQIIKIARSSASARRACFISSAASTSPGPG